MNDDIKIESKQIPSHVAIIMDGNGRWAHRLGKRRIEGHRAGAQTVDLITTECARVGVKRLTLYAFSLENWKRPPLEVKLLMSLLQDYLKRFRKKLMKNDIRLTAIGRLDMLSDGAYKSLKKTIEITAENRGLNLCLALSYGGRAEIVDAARALARKVVEGEIRPDDIDEDLFSEHIYQPDADPDLIIRTAGEMRLSNFLLWEASYSEFYVTPLCWPEFSNEEFHKAIDEYNRRTRKYGGLIESGSDKGS